MTPTPVRAVAYAACPAGAAATIRCVARLYRNEERLGEVSKIIVNVMLKGEIHDPQGEAISRACQRLGFSDVVGVRQGKRFEVDLSMAQKESNWFLQFAEDHVPSATNHPVLDDAERSRVGTLYASSPFAARKMGAAIVARSEISGRPFGRMIQIAPFGFSAPLTIG